MPTLQPAEVVNGRAIQHFKIESEPALPYLVSVTCTVPRDTLTGQSRFGVRRLPSLDTSWYQTQADLIARTALHDYYEITFNVTDSSGTDFVMDVVSGDVLVFADQTDAGGFTTSKQQRSLIDADAWAVANFGGLGPVVGEGPGIKFSLEGQRNGGNDIFSDRATLTGFGQIEDPLTGALTIRKMWTEPRQLNGYHTWGPLKRTLYKHIPMRAGGSYGYVHVWATVMAHTPEVQFIINWHNGVIEERTGGPIGGSFDPKDPLGGELQTNQVGFGAMRTLDFTFTRLLLRGISALEPLTGANTWKMTAEMRDSGSPADSAFFEFSAGNDVQSLVRQIQATDLNRRHVMPLMMERSFRFALHPSATTPYAKLVYGRSDWSRYGGWSMKPEGLPSKPLTSWDPDFTEEADIAKQRLNDLLPYTSDEAQDEGYTPQGWMWPGANQTYGGLTSGVGMLSDYGAPHALDVRNAAIEQLKVQQLRMHSRCDGAMYYNLSGLPVSPTWHTGGPTGQEGTWQRRDRRWTHNGTTGVKFGPFVCLPLNNPRLRAEIILDSDYNPTRAGVISGVGSTPLDYFGDTSAGVADWWAQSVPGSGLALDLEFRGAGYLRQANAAPPDSPPSVSVLGPGADESVPVEVTLIGGSTWDVGDSITFRITGTGEFDIAVTEEIVCAGQSGGYSSNKIWRTTSQFKKVTDIRVIAVSGTPAGTEFWNFGRAQRQLPLYEGNDNINNIDQQHSQRLTGPDIALFLLTNDPLSKLYVWMTAMEVRMHFWEHLGIAFNQPDARTPPGGRGFAGTRDFAYGILQFSQWLAIANAHFDSASSAVVWGSVPKTATFNAARWVSNVNGILRSSLMPNGLYTCYTNKNTKQAPFGVSNGGSSQLCVFYLTAGRDEAKFANAVSALCNVFIPAGSSLDGVRIGVDLLRTQDAARIAGIKDYLWDVTPSVDTGHHIYMPVARRVDASGNPVLFFDSTPPANSAADWIVYGSQATMPEFNPITGLAIRPSTYPTVAATHYATVSGASSQVPANPATAGTAFTLSNSNSGTQYGSSVGLTQAFIPTPIRLTITGGSTYTNAKKRTFRITGTGFNTYVDGSSNGQVSSVISDTIVAQGRGAATQTFQTTKHFVTVTEILIDNGTADAFGTVVNTETFSFGTAEVGLAFGRAIGESELIGGSEDTAISNLVAPYKYQGDLAGSSSAADTCIQRLTSTASLADALTVMRAWGEFGGPGRRIEQNCALVWQMLHNSPSITLAADFSATSTSGSGGSKRIGLIADKCVGKVDTYEWELTLGGSTINKTGKYVDHLFTTGSWTVKLTITGPAGTDVETKAAYITITA